MRVLFAVMLAGAALSLGVAPAAAATYGGGRLSVFAAKHYTPTAGVTLRTSGSHVRVRFVTSLRCRRDTYEHVVGAGSARVRKGRASLSGHSSFALGSGRVRYHWKVTLKVGPQLATGVLQIRGFRTKYRPGPCNAGPKRAFKVVRAAGKPGGQSVFPRAGAVYYGVNATSVARKLKGSVAVRVNSSATKVVGLWEAAARCSFGSPEKLQNFTPPTTVGRSHAFHRAEHFTVLFSNGKTRYQVAFGGQFHAGGIAGTLRLRARVYDRRGHLVARCDSGTRSWSARLPG